MDAGDNDPVRLFTYLGAALARSVPPGAVVMDAFSAPTTSVRAMVGQLLSVLGDRDAPTRLVLDDAHVLTDRACLDALSQLVNYLPPGSQLVLASRGPVDLPIARWRSSGRVLEVGPLDLAMDQEEAVRARAPPRGQPVAGDGRPAA